LTDNKNYFKHLERNFITPLGFLNKIKEEICTQITAPVPQIPVHVIKEFVSDLCDTVYNKNHNLM
jgi:hypothetical protein